MSGSRIRILGGIFQTEEKLEDWHKGLDYLKDLVKKSPELWILGNYPPVQWVINVPGWGDNVNMYERLLRFRHSMNGGKPERIILTDEQKESLWNFEHMAAFAKIPSLEEKSELNFTFRLAALQHFGDTHRDALPHQKNTEKGDSFPFKGHMLNMVSISFHMQQHILGTGESRKITEEQFKMAMNVKCIKKWYDKRQKKLAKQLAKSGTITLAYLHDNL